MIKNIKSIITSGKQLTLLSLILLSGGGMAYAQDTSVPDTVYVSFASSTALSTSMEYGTSCAEYVGKLSLGTTSLKFVWAAATNSGHMDMTSAQNTFKTGKAFKDITRFASLPTVKGGGKLVLDEAALQAVFDCKSADGSAYTGNDVVYKVSQSNGAFLEKAFAVTKASLIVTAKPITRVYGEANPTLTSKDFTFEGFKGSDSESIFDGSTENVLPTVTFGDAKDAMVYDLVVSGGSAANYKLTVNTPVKFTITKAPLTLTLPELSRKYDDKIETISVGDIKADGFKNSEKLTDLISEPFFHIIDPGKKDVGEYSYFFPEITKDALIASLKNYEYSFPEGKFVITKDEITITVFPADGEVNGEKVMQKVYGEKNPDGYFWLKKRTEQGSASSFAFSKAGSQDVKNYITALGVKGFTTLPVAGYFDYEKKAITEKTDVNLKKLSAPTEDSLYVATVANKNEIASTNYTFKVVDGSLLINQRPLKFQKVVVDRIYGETKQDTTWTFEATNAENKCGLASFDAAYQIASNTKAFKLIDVMPQLIIKKQAADSTLWAGSYTDTLQIKLVTADNSVTPRFKAADRNYKITFPLLSVGAQTNDSIRLEVAKANLKIKLGTIKRTFGSAVPDFNDAEIQKEFITYTGFKLDESANNLDSATVDTNGNRIKNLTVSNPNSLGIFSVAVYELTGVQEVNKRNVNYAITIEGKALYEVIPDNSLVLEWNPLTIDLIKGDKIKLDAKVKKEQGVIAEGAQIDFVSSDPNKIRIEKVDNYCYLSAEALTDNEGVTITASYHGLSGYDEVKKSVVYKVVRLKNEADYNVVLGDMSFVYDGTAKEADVKVTDLEGLKEYPHYVLYNGDTDLPVKAGIYNVSIYLEEGKGNSNLFIRKETMQIKAGEVTVTPKNVSMVYGAAIPESFEYTVNGFIGNDGFKMGKEPKVKVAGEITGTGEYTLYVEGGDPGDNYELITKTGLLTVTKSGLTIKADTIRSVYGDEIPEFTFTVTDPDGKKIDPETLNDIYTVKAKIDPKDAGEYDLLIDCAGVGENDYDVVMVPAKLYIAKAEADLTWNIDKTTIASGDTVLLTAEAVSPATITYKMQYDTVAIVKAIEEGAWIIGKHQGVTKLYISIPGEKNYLAANDSVTFNVTSPAVANESIALQGVGLYPTFVENEATVTSNSPVAMIRVFDASGRLAKLIEKPESLINLSELSKGYHLVQIVLESGEVKTVRIMKK